MKQLFLHAKVDVDLIKIVEKVLSKLEGKVAVYTTIQHLGMIKPVLEYLKKEKVNVVSSGQILGCIVPKDKVDTFLYLGQGKFHPIAILLKHDTKVICADPISCKVTEISKSDVERVVKKQKGAMLKFLTSNKIGVLVSMKKGQEHYNEAKKLEKKYPDKTFYYFVMDTLDFNEIENFPKVECYVNSMCPRIGFDDTIRVGKSIINLEEVL